MASEFCREAAVLVFVFGNLDLWLRGFTGELAKRAIGTRAIIFHVLPVFTPAAIFGAIGVLFEKWRDK
jgi:hypothetical protein